MRFTDVRGVGASYTETGRLPVIVPQRFRFIPLRLHAAADYLVGASFFLVPILADVPSDARAYAWTVAAIHTSMSLLTDYPGGVVKWIPLRVHLTAELITGPIGMALPWLAGFDDSLTATALFVVWGFISFATYFVTDRALPNSSDPAGVST